MAKSTRDRVVEIISMVTGIGTDLISDDMALEALNIESLDRIEIGVEIETEFNIIVMDEEAQAFKTVGDVVRLAEKAVAELSA